MHFLMFSLSCFSAWFNTLISDLASLSCLVSSTNLETFSESSLLTSVICNYYTLIFKHKVRVASNPGQSWSCSRHTHPWRPAVPNGFVGWRCEEHHQRFPAIRFVVGVRGSFDP